MTEEVTVTRSAPVSTAPDQLTRDELQTQLDKTIANVELFNSNLGDAQYSQTDNLEQKIKVNV